MPGLAPRVNDRFAAGVGWEQTVSLSAESGPDWHGLLAADGRHVITATVGRRAVMATPAFAEMGAAPGYWPATIAPSPVHIGVITCLRLHVPHPPRTMVRACVPARGSHGVAPIRAPNGLASWATVTFLGAVMSETDARSLMMARINGPLALPVPGTPVFSIADGACCGLLVPNDAVPHAPFSRHCLVATLEEAAVAAA